MNDETPNNEVQNGEAPAVEPKPAAPAHTPNPYELQRRESQRKLRELLSIPERDRTDEIWDKIVDLEIELAPGNRVTGPQSDPNRRQDGGQRHDFRQQKNGGRQHQRGARQQEQPGRGPDQRQGPKPGKRFFKKKGRRGGGGGGGGPGQQPK